MDVTLIQHTDNTRSVQYGTQSLALCSNVAWFTYKIISQQELDQIKTVPTERLQELLNKLFSMNNMDNDSGKEIQGTHHSHIPKGCATPKLLRRINKEALDQLEPGQNVGVYGLIEPEPINTNK